MRIILKVFLPLLLLFVAGAVTVTPAHATTKATNDQIYGIWFYQPPTDDVHIVYYNHASVDVSNEYFGTSYTDAATERCTMLLASQGMQLQYLVRYRQDPILGWVVYCYTDLSNYVEYSGADFGQPTIDAAVCRAQQIVYGTCIGKGTS